MGEHPSGWAHVIFAPTFSVRSSLLNSPKPLLIAHKSAPLAVGTITWSGKPQSSCSQVSKARLFEPST